MLNKILSSPSLKSTNFWTSIFLLVTAFFKATNNTLISEAFENISFIVSGAIATLNILSKIEWSSIAWLSFTKSSNFYIQLFGVVVSLFPAIERVISTGDIENLINTIATGNTTAIFGLIGALLIKIISSFVKPKNVVNTGEETEIKTPATEIQ